MPAPRRVANGRMRHESVAPPRPSGERESRRPFEETLTAYQRWAEARRQRIGQSGSVR